MIEDLKFAMLAQLLDQQINESTNQQINQILSTP